MTKIFVAKLDFNVSNDQLKSLFENYGEVVKASVALDKETGKSRGFAFVEMQDASSAAEAIKNLDGFAVNGRNIAVKQAEDRPKGDARQNDRRPSFDRRPQGDRPQHDRRPQGQRPYNNTGNVSSRNQTEQGNNDERTSFTPRPQFNPEDLNSLATGTNRKKTKDRPRSESDNDGSSKKPKMNAYKKSNKFKFDFDDDENIEGGLFSFNDEDDDKLD